MERYKRCKTVEIKDGVTEIGGSAFQNMSSIESVLIADTVTKTGDSAFSGCSGIAKIKWSSSLKEINNAAFYGCSSLKTVNFSRDKVKKIDSRASWGTGLGEVTVYSGIEYGGDVYYSCKNLVNAVIEDGVSVIPS